MNLNTVLNLFMASLRMGTPIAITALGAVVAERSGVLNIGLEGIMLIGAFVGVLGSYFTGSPYIGILLAMMAGGFISLIHGFVCITLGGNQPISSMAIILIGTGVSSFGLRAIFGEAGSSPAVRFLRGTPVLERFPIIGEFLSRVSPFIYVAFLLLIIIHYMLYHSPLGLRIRTVGEDPRTAETAGINVWRIRYLSVIFSGLLGGLGGAYLSLSHVNFFFEDMVAGRGFLALGAVIMGRWTPVGAFGAAMIFGFFSALQLYFQMFSFIPPEFIQIIPYLASVLILASFISETQGPASTGKPYIKPGKYKI